MADPPPIRRPAFVPPPIPPLRGAPGEGSSEAAPLEPLAPAPAATAVGEDVEDTRSLEAPAPSELVEELLAVAALELAALHDQNATARLADLEVRVALASWDTLARRDEAMRRCELAGDHPLAWRLAIAAAVDSPEALARVEHSLGDRASDAATIEIAEAWLWRHRDIDRALAGVERLLARALAPALREHVRELAIQLHGKAQRWPTLVELRRAWLEIDRAPEEVAAIAALVLDRGGDAAGALAACWSKLEHYPGVDEHASGWLRVFDIAIDAATRLDDPRRFELLDQRAELVAALPGGAQEALATRHAVASELERDGQFAEAAGVWTRLAEEPAADEAGAARRIAWLRAAWSAIGSGTEEINHRTALAARRALAVGDSVPVAATHAWRALELAVLVGDPSAQELARAVADASDSIEAIRWLEIVDTAASVKIARFAACGGPALRWAATLAESGEEAKFAIAIWRRAQAATPELPTTRDHVLRVARGSDEDALSEAYATAAAAEPDPRVAATLWCARGVVDIARGDVSTAETSLAKAAELAPDDTFCRAALATIYRATGRHDALARMLDELATTYASADARAAAAAERATLEERRAQELAQPPPEPLQQLRDAGRWAEVAAHLERELPTVDPSDGARVVEILLELGELRARHLGRLPEAVLAYESVLDRQADERRAIAALEQLYAQLGRDRELARILETRAEAEPDRATQSQLFARVAELRHDRDDIEGSIAAYAKAFAADPANRDVFTAMERVCYKAERWATALQLYADAIAHVESGQTRAYRLGDLYARRGNVQLNFLGQIDAAIASYQKVVEVDSNPTNAVKILEDVCQTRGDWQPLIHAYEKRAETQRDPARKADALAVAAQIAAQQAGDKRLSVRLNRKLLAMDPTSQTAAAALEAYYEDAQDRSGLVDVLKLKLQQAQDDAEAIEILKRIARTAEEGAKDVVTATEHYKKILDLQPKHREALEALARIYESTEQWAELVEVTRKLIEVTNDRNMKALLYFRCGSVIEAKFNREQDAIRYYDKAIRMSSACLPAVHGLRDLYRRREEWPNVIETLELEVKLWQDDKERAGVFAQIGQIHEKHLGDAERALQFYETAIQTDPECLLANQALFEHYYEQGDWQRAETFIEQLSAKAMREGDPQTRSEFFRKAGFVARMMGDPQRAAEDLISAVELRPTNTAALDDLGALAREAPEAWDFESAYLQLEKVYKKRDDADPLLARVHVGRAAIIERAGDLDQATVLYRQAVELAPGDLTVLYALVDFHADMRHWDRAVTAIELFVDSGAASPADRLAAMMRRAEIHADGAMQPERAIDVLHDIIAIEPGHQDAYYQLAQQYFLLGRYAEARDAIDRVIELATAPANQPLVAENIARYYYYKGRILDAAGESRSAAPQYRRAIEYDPGYAPPALVLARRAADAGDQRQAETLLIEAAHAAMATGGQRAAVPLQRGLARILLASGDRPAAIEAYRGILNVEPDGASDRVALAEIYAVDDPRRAIGELRKVLDRDIHHAPAYRSLAAIYSHIGDRERAFRVLTALDSLGFAEDEDRNLMHHLRSSRVQPPPRHPIDELARANFLLTPAAQQPLAEVFDAFAEELTSLVTQPSLGVNLTPAQHEPRLVQLANHIGALFEIDAEVFIAEKVPGFVAVTAFPRRLLVIDRTLLAEADPPLRFLFGYAFEAIRGGYATLLQVGARKRRELALLLRALLTAETEPSGAAVELVNKATPEQQQVLDDHAGATGDAAAWMDGMLALAKRAGLLMCDDFAAAIWMVARLAGEQLASHDETIALGSVLGGPDLVRFYLSDEYQQLRDRLTVGA